MCIRDRYIIRGKGKVYERRAVVLSVNVVFRLLSLLAKPLFLLDRLTPIFLRTLLKASLAELVGKGMMKSYNLRVKRVKKLHYQVKLEVIIDKDALGEIISRPPLKRSMEVKTYV